MDIHALRARFEDPASYLWVPLGALRAGEFLSCIDGRHGDHVISAPGGDLGEAVLLLGAVEQVRGVPFTTAEIAECMQFLMDWHSRFYMHTDEDALRRLASDLADEPAFQSHPLTDLDRLRDLVVRPGHEHRERLAQLLGEPRYVGCGHLQQMLLKPQRYGVRKPLVAGVIRAFFRRMWDGAPSAQFVVLEGVHDERAFVRIEVEGEPDAGLFVPAISGTHANARTFVEHAAARVFLRASFLDVLEHNGVIADMPDDVVLRLCEDLAQQQLDATLGALAPDLPRFTVTFGESHAPMVRR